MSGINLKWKQNFYLMCDVLLLADVFQKSKNNSLKNYTLFLSHYLSAPGLSWNALLKMTRIILELIADPDMYMFYEKGRRIGISYISNRYSKANNKYLKSYDPKQKSKHIIYVDTNNFYGYAMSKFLSTIGFKWTGPKEFDLNNYASNNSKWFVIETDLEYQKELHELYDDPLALDKIEIKSEIWLSIKNCWFMQYSNWEC